ncbi:alpha/beta fold hydrolase [Parvularcula maris]|uniref:Alpha/beta fold hydrolase n=1 Tax=Parvularcula maris TaxID=2965077 RepID=A0A9X2RIG1_9PROT|nr:alpha/beta fold hydrolase [Parvularcula maris]MCQ8186015.1 alpha/beta fold hydrolase [Parvularcula maris]
MRIVFAILGLLGFAVAAVFVWTGLQQRTQNAGAAPDQTELVLPPAQDEPADLYADVAGARIRYRVSGPEDGPTLLLLHGFTFSLESWDALADRLDERYRVVRYDLLGHGLTGPDPQERYAPGDRASFAGEVIRALALEQPVVIGNSLGGLIAWRLAAAEPELVRSLVLIAPGAFPFNGVTEEPAPIPPGVAFFLRSPSEPLLRASLASVYADPAVITEQKLALVGERMKGNGDAFIRSLELFTLPDPSDTLSVIEQPTLIIWGEEDRIIPPMHGPLVADAMPKARLITYQGIGHVPQEEVPGRVAGDIEAFLEGLEPSE